MNKEHIKGTKVKVVTGFKKQDFEKEVNEVLATHEVISVEYNTVVKNFKGDDLVGYAAYITIIDKEGQPELFGQ